MRQESWQEIESGRIRYEDPLRGLTPEVRGRHVTAYQAEDFVVWGTSGMLVLDPGADRLGLSLRVQPSWGKPDSGVQNLWQRPAVDLRTVADDGRTPAHIDTEIGYGLTALGGRGIFALQGGFGMEEDDLRTLRLVGLLETGDAFKFDLTGERTLLAGGKPARKSKNSFVNFLYIRI